MYGPISPSFVSLKISELANQTHDSRWNIVKKFFGDIELWKILDNNFYHFDKLIEQKDQKQALLWFVGHIISTVQMMPGNRIFSTSFTEFDWEQIYHLFKQVWEKTKELNVLDIYTKGSMSNWKDESKSENITKAKKYFRLQQIKKKLIEMQQEFRLEEEKTRLDEEKKSRNERQAKVFLQMKKRKRDEMETELKLFNGNVYDILKEDSKLENFLRWKFGAQDTFVPIVLNHAIGKFASSFPSIYLTGKYPADIVLKKSEDNSLLDVKKSLIAHAPWRKGIHDADLKLHEFKQESFVRDPKVFFDQLKKVDLKESEGAASTDLRNNQVQQYLNDVDKESNPTSSALARLILQQTVLVQSVEFDRMLQLSWKQFVQKQKDLPKKEPYFLFVPTKYGSDQWLVSKLVQSKEYQEHSFPWKGLALEDKWLPLKVEGTANVPNHIVIIDDMLYSGIQKEVTLKEMLLRITAPDLDIPLVFHFVIPMVTSKAINLLLTLTRNPRIQIFFYPIVRAFNIQDLFTCQKQILKSITNFSQATRLKLSSTNCPTLCSLSPQYQNIPACNLIKLTQD